MSILKKIKRTIIQDELNEFIYKYEAFLNYLSYIYPMIDFLFEWKQFTKEWEKENKS